MPSFAPASSGHEPVSTVFLANGYARKFQQATAGIALLTGVATLIGLAFGIDVLTRWIDSPNAMNPVTATLLVVGAIAMLLPVPMQRRALPIVAWTLIGIAVAKLVQSALGQSGGFDQQAWRMLASDGTSVPGVLSINTALVFLLIGGAMAIGQTQRTARATVAQLLAILAIAIAVLSLICFVLDAVIINQWTTNRMAANTSVGLAALAMSAFALNPERCVTQLLFYDGPSGKLARIALPIGVAAPILIGYIRLTLEEHQVVRTGDGVAIMVAANIALSLGLVLTSLIPLLRTDTDRCSKAAALEVIQDQYRQTCRIGKVGHWQYDLADKRLRWTSEFCTLLGIDADEPPDLSLVAERIHPDDREVTRRLLRRAERRGENWNGRFRIIAADGEIKYAKTHGLCRRNADGSVQSVFGVVADITELETARQEAEVATGAQAAFLANMSHEIRTPLNGMLGFIDLLLETSLDSAQRRHLNLVRESAQLLMTLLNDILDLSKVQAGHVEIMPEAADLRRTIRQAVRLMNPVAARKGIALKLEIGGDVPPAVLIDAGRVRQILLNLLGNALKFTSEGEVIVSLRVGPGAAGGPAELRQAIRDTGVGIPANRTDAVFGAFVQADNSTSRKFGGSGLGLSISRQLAEAMGGTLLLDSEEGHGTTVELVLPLVAAPASAITERIDADVPDGHGATSAPVERLQLVAASAPPQPTGGFHFLVVEDIPINRELIGAMLGQLGHEVEFAVNGTDAVGRAARLAHDPNAWDMIFMDIQMPVMNGTDAARAIRALSGAAADIPIIALSANAFAEQIEESLAAGMNGHVVKPIGFAELRETIEQWTHALRSKPLAPAGIANNPRRRKLARARQD